MNITANKAFISIMALVSIESSLCFANQPNESDTSKIRLISDEQISGSSLERNQTGKLLEDGETRTNQIGGLGGAITYTGKGNLYFMIPDRGPGAGETTYKERFYLVEIKPPNPKDNKTHPPKILGMHYLKNEKGATFTGDASAYDPTNSKDSLRLDAEGARLSIDKKHLFISDEYGPFIDVFDVKTGIRTESLKIPNKFLIDIPARKGKDELDKNKSGRQSNRGFEGLAISSSGRSIFTITQDPLIQDCEEKEGSKLYGTKNRILEIDLMGSEYYEYEYILDSPDNGVSELVSIGDRRLLSLERDGKSGNDSKSKRIYLVDLDGATNIHEKQSLSERHQEAGKEIKPVTKTLFIDLQKIGINNIPEKVEGMTFGPDLDDETSLLVVSTDNDFKKNEATRIFLISVPKSLIKTKS